ncbi:hypothetical protein Y032_0008g375 [Ancylostoma ceylanicum]|uniref:Uncharacterized protein n=1 Tax=Ancylostoma ceylanicum TaxID=53326 RepID=A0A016VMD0_9BILA|nr:hypothetical protein Y032_0008g375 [Ancylostoma ceylanicum]
MCRANVYRLRYVRPDPVVIVCKVSPTLFPRLFRLLTTASLLFSTFADVLFPARSAVRSSLFTSERNWLIQPIKVVRITYAQYFVSRMTAHRILASMARFRIN